MIRILFIFLSLSLATSSTNTLQNKTYKLIIFEGSDWCANCIRFNTTIIENPDFITYAKAHHITIEHIDFPQKKSLSKTTETYNASIAEKYNFNGVFPTLILVNGDTSYQTLSYKNESTQEFIALLKSKIEVY